MSLWLIILITLIGLALVALEIVALPGGIAGICGGAFVAVGIWQAYAVHGTMAGSLFLASSVVVGIAMIALLLKSKTWKRAALNEAVSAKANVVSVQVGDEGITLSRLAPAGKALIKNEQVEVHASCDFLDPDTPIRVVEVDGYRVVVEKTNI